MLGLLLLKYSRVLKLQVHSCIDPGTQIPNPLVFLPASPNLQIHFFRTHVCRFLDFTVVLVCNSPFFLLGYCLVLRSLNILASSFLRIFPAADFGMALKRSTGFKKSIFKTTDVTLVSYFKKTELEKQAIGGLNMSIWYSNRTIALIGKSV